MTALAYKANAREAVERLRSLYERRARDRIFATFAISGADADVLRRGEATGAADRRAGVNSTRR